MAKVTRSTSSSDAEESTAQIAGKETRATSIGKNLDKSPVRGDQIWRDARRRWARPPVKA